MDGSDEDRAEPTLSTIWEFCADIAVQLDEAEADWRKLAEVGAEFQPLADELELVVQRRIAGARRAEGALKTLRRSVQWVEQHEYDAPEWELRHSLDHALRSAIYALELMEQGGQTKEIA